MEIVASPATSRRLLALRWPYRLLFVAVGVAAVVCAVLAQHASGPDDVPTWVVAVSVLAILTAAIALPTPIRTTVVHAEREQSTVLLTGAGLLALPTLVAFLLWGRESFSVYQM